jgi:hypothetical protein
MAKIEKTVEQSGLWFTTFASENSIGAWNGRIKVWECSVSGHRLCKMMLITIVLHIALCAAVQTAAK